MRCRRRGAAPCALTWIALAPSLTRAAVSGDDLLKNLGGTANGQTLTTAAYSLTMLASDDKALISISLDSAMSKIGWVGWGLGTGMAGADIVVLWPNSDSSWTLSHRNAASTVMPTLVDSPASSDPSTDASGSLKVIGDLSSSSSSDSPTVVTFSRPLTMPSDYKTDAEMKDLKKALNQPVIFAVGTKNPGASDPGSDLEQHALTSMGATFIDLSVAFDPSAAAVEAPLYALEESEGGGAGSATNSSSSGTGATKTTTGSGGGATSTDASNDGEGPTSPAGPGGATPSSRSALASGVSSAGGSASTTGSTTSSSTSTMTYSKVILYHAYAGVLSWGVLAPLGVLIARLGRSCGFFPWHRGVQLITLSATIAAVGLGYWATTLRATTTVVRDTHVYLGFTILALVVAHFLERTKEERARGREMKSWAHIILGISLITGGFVQIRLGMTQYGVTSSQLIYGYWGIVGAFSTLYVASALITIAHPAPPPPPSRRRRHHPHRSERHSHPHSHEEHHHHHHHQPRSRKHDHRHHKKPARRKKGKKHRRKEDEEKELMSSSEDSGSESSSGGSSSESGSSGSDSSSESDHRRRRKK